MKNKSTEVIDLDLHTIERIKYMRKEMRREKKV